LFAAALALSACVSQTGPGGVAGTNRTTTGAVTGALIGAAVGANQGGSNRAGQAAVGAVVGGALGGLVGSALDLRLGSGLTGKVVAAGTPEDVIKNPKSYTGQYLGRKAGNR
jgi:phage tail tape-measure protein